MANKVIILGGGIGGLSAAHELIERGFDVEVYEAQAIPGGKARSIPVPGSGKDGRKDLPGEHGFRFFPRFYKHVVDIMRRIPNGHGATVADNLVDTTRIQLCRFGRHPIEVPARFVRTINDVRVILDDLGRFLGGDLGISHDELAFFTSRVWQVVTSCGERRMNEYEKIGWWEFIGAESRSLAYQKLLGHGITRSLVAAKANEASTKTIGDIFVQLLFDMVTPGPSTDRVLNGPTNEVWIGPWLDYLQSKGVRYHLGSKVKSVTLENGRIRDIQVENHGASRKVEGDYFVFAVPVEDIVDLLTPPMLQTEPALASLYRLDDITEWMNGIQIYLKEDVKIAHGHSIYVDSPWALTSISQAQFWGGVDLSQYGDGNVRGIISVDISEWEHKGLNGKTAKECTPEELKAEVWDQLKRSLNYGDQIVLHDDQLHDWFLDPGVLLREGDSDTNEEPLLVNLVDTWKLRPEAVTRIANMFLASDYVRTFTDLATMEAANEAARRAVNGILDASGSDRPRCPVWALHELEIFVPWRELDRIRYQQGLPWDDTLVDVGLSLIKLVDRTILALERGSERNQIFSGQGVDLRALQKEASAIIERDSENQVVSELRRDGMALIERLVQVFALRLAEGRASGLPPTPLDSASSLTGATSRTQGRVRILPQ